MTLGISQNCFSIEYFFPTILRLCSDSTALLTHLKAKPGQIEQVFAKSQTITKAISGDHPLILYSSGTTFLRLVAKEPNFEWLAKLLKENLEEIKKI